MQSRVEGLFSLIEPFEPQRSIFSMTIEISNLTPDTAEPALGAGHVRLVRATNPWGRGTEGEGPTYQLCTQEPIILSHCHIDPAGHRTWQR